MGHLQPFEGRRLTGTALVADVSGFTQVEIALNAKGREGIEEFGETLHAIFDCLVHLAIESGALVLEFAGDALITFFDDADFQQTGTEAGSFLKAHSCALQMMSTMRAFPAMRLHGGIARGSMRTLHLGVQPYWDATSGEHDWRCGNLFMGSALQTAVKLLDASAKGEVLVEEGHAELSAPLRDSNLPAEFSHMGSLKWFPDFKPHPLERNTSLQALQAVPHFPDLYRTSEGSHKDGKASGLRVTLRRPSLLARAAQKATIDLDCEAQVKNTWQLVKADLEATGIAFFKYKCISAWRMHSTLTHASSHIRHTCMHHRNIFRIAPVALELFSFRDVPDLYSSAPLKRHALAVMNAVGLCIAGLSDLAKLVPVLTELGRKHLSYGVMPAHYDVVGQALIETLAAGLGAHFTPAARHSWTSVYATVAGVMKSAAQKAQDEAEEETRMTEQLGKAAQAAMASSGLFYMQKYVLRHVFAPAVRADSQRMSELRIITSLFCRVPVPIPDGDSPFDIERHNDAFIVCHECVERSGGVVNQYLWDDKGVIMKACWGMLRPTRDDRRQATLCALQLVEKLSGTQVGVACGEAFCGLVGAEGMRLGMVMFGAESVTLAARLMMKARQGSVLVSAEVRGATELHIAFEGDDEPELVLKGRDRNEPVCRPLRPLGLHRLSRAPHSTMQQVDSLTPKAFATPPHSDASDRSTSTSPDAVPSELSSRLIASIDVLSAAEADVLKCASCIGKEFETAVLEVLAGRPLPVLLRLLESLVGNGMILATDEGVYQFASAEQHAATYSLLMQRQRERLHALIASIYEFDATEVVPQHALLAQHYELAGAGSRIDAAEHHAAASMLADDAGAIVHLERAIALARHSDSVPAVTRALWLARLARLTTDVSDNLIAASALAQEALDTLAYVPQSIQVKLPKLRRGNSMPEMTKKVETNADEHAARAIAMAVLAEAETKLHQ